MKLCQNVTQMCSLQKQLISERAILGDPLAVKMQSSECRDCARIIGVEFEGSVVIFAGRNQQIFRIKRVAAQVISPGTFAVAQAIVDQRWCEIGACQCIISLLVQADGPFHVFTRVN